MDCPALPGTILGLQTNKPFKIKSVFPWRLLIKVSSRIRINMRSYPDEITSYYNCLLPSASQSVAELFIPAFYLCSYHGVAESQVFCLYLQIISH